jgi:putative SOS response-associated peptidase YedK
MMAQIHNSKRRMPAILLHSEEDAWIDKDYNTIKAKKLLQPISDKYLEAWPISNLINDKYSNRNRPELIARKDDTLPSTQSIQF